MSFRSQTTHDRIRRFALVGANLDRANLRGKDLRNVNFSNGSFRGADFTDADLRGALFLRADLSRACFHGADLAEADLSGSDMSLSYYKAANFTNAVMQNVCLRCSMGKNALFLNTDLTASDFVNAFLVGARFDGAIMEEVRNWDRAIFRLWVNPAGGRPSYDPVAGWIEQTQSFLGGMSLQENAARGHA